MENKVIDALFNNTSFTPPAVLYLALYTTDPTAANTGTQVTGGSYARQAIDFVNGASGATSHNAAITFTDLPAATITHYGILDAATAGNLIVFGQLAITINAAAGDEAVFSNGDIAITFTGQ